MKPHAAERRGLRGLVFLAWTLLALQASPAAAQTPNASFSMLGYLQELDVTSLADPLSAGTMKINGIDVVLPRNLLIKMPGQYLTLNDLFRGPHPGSAPALSPAVKPSGLALKDVPRPPVAFEVQVIGNIVGGTYVAGWVNITQQDLNAGAGFIRAIDYAKGELLVGPASGLAVARVRINDPAGRYGLANAAKVGGTAMDERFAADPGNAPVSADTGFPMCIPRVAPPAIDPACPLTNRAPAPDTGRFTCGLIPAEPTAPAQPGCQPGRAAPLVVGDYITFNGMLTEDSPGTGTFFHAAHAVHAMAGIYTSPGANPAYVFIEEALVGTLGEVFPGIDQEETSRFRTVGFTTDPSRRVEVFVIDVVGNTEVERRLTTLTPSPVAQIGRVRVTLPAKANFLPITRDVRYRIEGHSSVKVAGGLDSGQYTAPVGEYIYPENTRFGRPRLPVGVPFENFCFLKNGGGLLGTLGRDGLADAARPPIGPLTPFPDSGHPASQRRADNSLACL
ncbi:hypothetical protein [Hydrogenophaga sp. RWCD_12]|uniref:hypothetical protein n=1 Tax=Hydrogenophaga sp. RWCD_12 TaxID=3391190 RepID=UPI0039847606